jgi:hypothetical protein
MMKLKVGLVCLLSFGAMQAFAEDTFARKVNGLSTYKGAFANLEQVRRTMLDPKDGLILGLHETNGKLRDWTFQYRQSIQNALEGLKQGGAFEVYLSKLEELSSQYNQTLGGLVVEYMNRQTAIQNMLARFPRETLNYQIPGFADQQKQFEGFKSAILDSVRDGLMQNEKVYRDLTDVQVNLKELYKAKARQILLQRNIDQIDAKISQIDAVLSRAAAVAPYIQSIQAANSTYNQAYLTLDYFEMKKRISELKGACTSYYGFVDGNPAMNRNSQKEQAVIKHLCETTPKDFDSLVQGDYGNNVKQIVADAVVYYRKPAVEEYCRTKNAGRYNCSLYSWAGKLGAEDILQLNDKELQDLEDVWAAIFRKKG